MENEVKKEGQESIEDTIITTAPVVDDVIAEETPAVEPMPAIEPIPAAEPAPAPVEEVVEAIPAVEPVVEPIVEEVPAVEPAPVAEPAPEPAPVVEEVKTEEVVAEPAPAVETPAPVEAPAPVEEAPKDEVKGVEVNPNVVTEAKPAEPVQNAVDQAPAVDLNGGNFKEEAEPKNNANSWPKIIAAFIILALLILIGFNIDKIKGLFTNLDNNSGNGGEVTPTPTPDTQDEETKLTCSKSVTDAAGTVTLETYSYTGTNKLLRNYTVVTTVSNPADVTVLTQAKEACEAEKIKYLSEAGYSLTCELVESKNSIRTLVVDSTAYKLYADSHADEGMGAPADDAEINPETAEPVAVPVVVPAPEYDLDANMEDIKTQKVALGYTCE